MLCYKDMSFCTATDCGNLECIRNTRGSFYNPPDDFWKEHTCYADFQRTCKDYKKENNMNKCENCGKEFTDEDTKFDIEDSVVCVECADDYVRENGSLLVTATDGTTWRPCAWCGELFPQDALSQECDLGQICQTCTMGIMSRGENLSFTVNGVVPDVD